MHTPRDKGKLNNVIDWLFDGTRMIKSGGVQNSNIMLLILMDWNLGRPVSLFKTYK